jgi:uncharacterized RDD family membrane protein YckC
MNYAGFWRRGGALIIDGIIVGMISWLFKIVSADLWAIDILFGLLYTPVFESSTLQATPGKALLDMRVVSMAGGRITFKKAMIRYLVRIVSGLLLCFGFFMMLFTEKKQTLHDLAAETLVVRGEVKSQNYFQAWYQQVLQILGMVDKVPTTPIETTTSMTSHPQAASPSDLAGLYDLYQKGILTEAEYIQKREDLLKKL